jgi:hypothetical protein
MLTPRPFWDMHSRMNVGLTNDKANESLRHIEHRLDQADEEAECGLNRADNCVHHSGYSAIDDLKEALDQIGQTLDDFGHFDKC